MGGQHSEHNEDNTFAKEALLCEIGLKLEQARESRGLSREQVAKELKLSETFLEALETGQWSKMPGEVYALGFFRQYAALLGLDVSVDIQRIKTSTYELTVPLTYPDAPISPNKTWVVAAILLFFLIIIVSNLMDVETEQVTKVEQANEAPTTAVIPTDAYASLATADTETATETSDKAATLVVEAEKRVMPPQQTTSGQERPAPGIPANTYTFSAVTEDVWLQVFQTVSDEEEPLLLREALLKMGESFILQSDTTLMLTCGKPTALKIEKNGDVLFEAGQLGQENRILKSFPLD